MNRDCVIKIVVNKKEHAAIVERARKANLSMSAYTRWFLFHGTETSEPPAPVRKQVREPFTDEARAIMLDDDDITPIDGARGPRGDARRGSVKVGLDQVAGEFDASNKPTADPPDLARRRSGEQR